MITFKPILRLSAIFKLKPCFPSISSRQCSVKPFDIKTNVTKDIILFKYDNPKFYKYMNIFGVVQFGFWGFLSIFAFQSLRDAPVTDRDKASWWQKVNLGENKYKNILSISSFAIGYGILIITWIYTLKSVRYLILNKGGNKITMVTYTPFGENRIFATGLENINCQQSRASVSSYLPLKVKGHYFYYIMDMRGEFKNATLFDYTAGLKRKFS